MLRDISEILHKLSNMVIDHPSVSIHFQPEDTGGLGPVVFVKFQWVLNGDLFEIQDKFSLFKILADLRSDILLLLAEKATKEYKNHQAKHNETK